MKKILLLLLISGTICTQDIDDVWTVENKGSIILASVNGKITYGDRLIFLFSKSTPCDEPQWITSFYSTQNEVEKKIENLNIEYLNITLNEVVKTYANIISVSPFLMGSITQMYIGRYPIKKIQESFGLLEEISIELISIPKTDTDIESIYDITKNTFSTTNLNEALEQAKADCLKL
tara:strand:+ start:40 stop:570 length:531 start_codon:yes stop_codon:yes gene_type:complete